MSSNKYSIEANGYYITPQFLPGTVKTAIVENHFYISHYFIKIFFTL